MGRCRLNPLRFGGVILRIRFAVMLVAKLTDRLLYARRRSAGMTADIAALGTGTVFPLMCLLCDDDRAAAVDVFPLMGRCRLNPLRFGGVILRVLFAVMLNHDDQQHGKNFLSCCCPHVHLITPFPAICNR